MPKFLDYNYSKEKPIKTWHGVIFKFLIENIHTGKSFTYSITITNTVLSIVNTPLSKEIKLARKTKGSSIVRKELGGEGRETREKNRKFVVASHKVAEEV